MANFNELTQADLDFLKRLDTGEARLNEIHRKQVVQIFAKILRNPTSIKAREWLLSELLKIKKLKFQQQKDFANQLMIGLSGNSLSDKCPHCGVKFN